MTAFCGAQPSASESKFQKGIYSGDGAIVPR
jgi:hypothetical protein